MKVFLGGTCCESKWREELISLIEKDDIEYFNPVVPDWTEECQKEELKQREICNVCLYTITPEMTGVYSIAEVVDDSNKKPDSTVLCILNDIPVKSTKSVVRQFTPAQLKSLDSVAKLVERNGAKAFYSLEEVSMYLRVKKMEEEFDVVHILSAYDLTENVLKNIVYEVISDNRVYLEIKKSDYINEIPEEFESKIKILDNLQDKFDAIFKYVIK